MAHDAISVPRPTHHHAGFNKHRNCRSRRKENQSATKAGHGPYERGETSDLKSCKKRTSACKRTQSPTAKSPRLSRIRRGEASGWRMMRFLFQGRRTTMPGSTNIAIVGADVRRIRALQRRGMAHTNGGRLPI